MYRYHSFHHKSILAVPSGFDYNLCGSYHAWGSRRNVRTSRTWHRSCRRTTRDRQSQSVSYIYRRTPYGRRSRRRAYAARYRCARSRNPSYGASSYRSGWWRRGMKNVSPSYHKSKRRSGKWLNCYPNGNIWASGARSRSRTLLRSTLPSDWCETSRNWWTR